MRQTWKRSNERRKTKPRVAEKSLPILSSPPYKPNDNERPGEKRRMKQTSSPEEEIILLSEPTDGHQKSTGAKINDRIKIKVAELQGIVSQLKIDNKLTEEKLKAMEERVRQLNTKKEVSEMKSSKLRDTVSQLLEEKKVAERKTFRAEEKLSQFEMEKELLEKRLKSLEESAR